MRICASDLLSVAKKIVKESGKQDSEGEEIMKSYDSGKVQKRVAAA